MTRDRRQKGKHKGGMRPSERKEIDAWSMPNKITGASKGGATWRAKPCARGKTKFWQGRHDQTVMARAESKVLNDN